MYLYTKSKSQVRAVPGTSEQFKTTVGIHQRSALSQLPFNIFLDKVNKEFREQGLWELLFADDLMLIAESKEVVLEMFNK